METTQNEWNEGYCSCCRKNVKFLVTAAWLRDFYFCDNCRSIPRQRHINHILDRFFPGWERLCVHESSPSNDFVKRWCHHYSCSQFLEGVSPGEEARGWRCEDIERLTFPADTFDLFITQDVMEHIFHPDRAFRQIMRVVKPGGAHVFTAPKHKNLRFSRRRAHLDSNGLTVFDLDPQYHGNPVGDGRSLVTWDYGDNFERLIWEWCKYATVTYMTRDRALGLDGEFLEVFVTRKV